MTRYEQLLKKMKDYDENIAKEKIAIAAAEKEKKMMEVCTSLSVNDRIYFGGRISVSTTYY